MLYFEYFNYDTVKKTIEIKRKKLKLKKKEIYIQPTLKKKWDKIYKNYHIRLIRYWKIRILQ